MREPIFFFTFVVVPLVAVGAVAGYIAGSLSTFAKLEADQAYLRESWKKRKRELEEQRHP